MSFGTVDKGLLSSSLLDHGPLPVAMMFLIVAEKDKYGVTMLNPRIMSKLLKIPLSLAQEGWNILTSPDPESSNPEHDGRRLIPDGDGKWLVVSHAKYAAEHSLALKRIRDREAQQRHRDRLKVAGEVPGDTKSDSGDLCEVCGEAAVVAVAGARFCGNCVPEGVPIPHVSPDPDDEGVV